ncbi:hypothetical protein BJ742DRAFT_740016 [Cladochytrium replicatum]|nr:hypothetical protein BJ742DRAFT_740016 [Cladochytrium replicatum]
MIGEQNLKIIMEQVTASTVKRCYSRYDLIVQPGFTGNQTDAFRELVNALRAQPVQNGLICSATENVTVLSSTPPPQIGVYDIVGDTSVVFVDDTTGWKYNVTIWDSYGPGPSRLQPISRSPLTKFNASWDATYYLPTQSSGSSSTSSTIIPRSKIDFQFQANTTTDSTISSLVVAMQQYSNTNGTDGFVSPTIFDSPTMMLYGYVAGSLELFLVRADLLSVMEANWVAVVAIPYDGFFGTVDLVRVRTIISAAVLGVVRLTLTLFLSYFTVRPLTALSRVTRKTIKMITRLTKFDFSLLEGETVDGWSRITEINVVQDTFMTMVRAFAVYLKINRAIATGKFTIKDSVPK